MQRVSIMSHAEAASKQLWAHKEAPGTKKNGDNMGDNMGDNRRTVEHLIQQDSCHATIQVVNHLTGERNLARHRRLKVNHPARCFY